DIRDKEQRVWYNNLLNKGANLTVIFDCCHSGSMSRGGEPVYARPKFRKIEQNPNDAKDGALPPDPISLAGDRLLVISAAQDFELAAEATDNEGKPHGAFSMALMTAMNQVSTGVAVGNIFTAVRNILKSNGVAQEPQIVCSDNRLKQNLLGVDASGLSNSIIVSLLENPSGKGWEISAGSGLGLKKGNEFSMMGNPGLVIKIDSVMGVARASVRLVKGNAADMQAGRLFELSNWINEEQPLLSIYVPENNFNYAAVKGIAQRFSDIRSKQPDKWIDNLKKQVPDVSAWFLKGQMQMQVKGEMVTKADWKTLEVIVDQPDVKYAIFYLPVPAELKAGLESNFKDGTSYQITRDPSHAQYHVSGQVGRGGVPEYYLMNRASAAKDSLEALPNETNRHALTSAEQEKITSLSYQLFEYAVRIGRIRGWLQINGPVNRDFPYELEVVNEDKPVGPEGLRIGQTATLRMKGTEALKNPDLNIREKYLYAFAIDRDGAMSLIYPEKGSGERFPPKTGSGEQVSEFVFGSFEVVEPVGTDNFFVLAVKDPIPNPQAIFNQEGVYTSRNANLSGLLDPLLNMGTRSVKLGRTETPSDWNLLKLPIKSRH
ncbi:MAG: caspase family protein, partial [Chitinophagaceae bacterium]|nr:caspase family protein [Chitinophagaceae bacterium]